MMNAKHVIVMANAGRLVNEDEIIGHLSSNGYAVEVARDARTFIRLLQSQPGYVTVVVDALSVVGAHGVESYDRFLQVYAKVAANRELKQ